MTDHQNRHPPVPPRTELVELRKKKFPGMFQRDFAGRFLGVSRLHMTSIEQGRRQPSIELMLRWLEVLGPEATVEMFGDVPAVDTYRKLQERIQKKAA